MTNLEVNIILDTQCVVFVGNVGRKMYHTLSVWVWILFGIKKDTVFLSKRVGLGSQFRWNSSWAWSDQCASKAPCWRQCYSALGRWSLKLKSYLLAATGRLRDCPGTDPCGTSAGNMYVVSMKIFGQQEVRDEGAFCIVWDALWHLFYVHGVPAPRTGVEIFHGLLLPRCTCP